MQLEFFGAAGEVTGSCHILTVNGQTVLLDCGMIQGGRKQEARNREPFPFDPTRVDAVVLSHAHIDHSGRLPLLVKRGFPGVIWCHNATRDLCGILLEDSAQLAERDAEYNNRRYRKQGRAQVKPLYSVADAHDAISKLKGIRYQRWQEVVPGMKIRFHDAGHIMGSGKCRGTPAGRLGGKNTGVQRRPRPVRRANPQGSGVTRVCRPGINGIHLRRTPAS